MTTPGSPEQGGDSAAPDGAAEWPGYDDPAASDTFDSGRAPHLPRMPSRPTLSGTAEKGRQAADSVGKNLDRAGRGVQAGAKGTKAAARGAQAAAKGTKAAAGAADAASTAATSSGKALQAVPVVGNIAGAGLLAGGGAAKVGAKGTKAAASGMDRAAQGVHSAADKADQVGKKMSASGKKVRSAVGRSSGGKGGMLGALKPSSPAGAGSGPGTGAGHRAAAKSNRFSLRKPLSSAAAKVTAGASGSAVAGKATKAAGRAVGMAVKGVMAATGVPAGVGVGMVGMAGLLVFSLFAFSIFGGGAIAVPSFQPDENDEAVGEDSGQLDPAWIDPIKRAAEDELVPWPLIAAIGSVATDSGRVDPYTGQRPTGNIAPPSGKEGGVGPYLLSDWVIGKFGGRGNPQTVEGGARIIAAALADWANEKITAGYVEAPDSDAELTADGEVALRRVTVTDLTRFANLDRDTVPDDHRWTQSLDFWRAALHELDLYEPSGNEYCVAGVGTTVTAQQRIEAVWRCAAASLDTPVIAVTAEGRIEGEAALDIYVDEAVSIAEMFQRQTSCDPENPYEGGWYPVESGLKAEQVSEFNEDLGKTVTYTKWVVDPAKSRCSKNWGLERVATSVLSRAAVPWGDREGNDEQRALYGWDAIPRVLGSANEFATEGFPGQGDWVPDDPDRCRTAMGAFVASVNAYPEGWPADAAFLTVAPLPSHRTAWGALATHPYMAGDGDIDGVVPACGLPFDDQDVIDLDFVHAMRRAFQQSGGTQSAITPVAGPQPIHDGAALRDAFRDFLDTRLMYDSRDPGAALGWVARTANPAVIMPDFNWQPLGFLFEQAVINQTLYLLGEECPDGTAIGGGQVQTASFGGGAPASGDLLDRATEAAREAHAAGFRGEDLTTIVAIAGAESTWTADARNASSTATGMWQIMASVWLNPPSPLAVYGWTRNDLHDVGNNAIAAYTVYEDAIRTRSYERRFEPWEVTHAAVDSVTASHYATARSAIAAAGVDPGAPPPTGSNIQPGSSTTPTSGCATTSLMLSGSGDWTCAVAGPVSFINDWGFPRSGGRTHEGLDMFADKGTPLVAVGPGVIGSLRASGLGGITVRVITNDPENNRWYYTHLDSIAPGLVEGQVVQAGHLLGYVGTSGNAAGTPPHLHLGRYPNAGAGAAQPLFHLMQPACAANMA